MHLSRAFLFLTVVAASGCEKKAAVPPPPPPQQLTEKDTEPHSGALSGDGWRLPLDDRWLVVKVEARTRFKPETQAWAVDPEGPVHLTVECREASESVEASLRAQLALGREKAELEGVALGAVPSGPWLEGALAQWAVADVVHAMGRFRLISATCDVRAWGPRKGGAALVDRLRSTVLAFGASRAGLVNELNALAGWIGPRARQAPPDAGAMWIRVRTEEALRAAPAALLVERFTMRLRLLDEIGVQDCARLVRHRLEESPRLLERLPEPVAVRWVQVTREALTLADATDASVPSSSPEMIKAVVRLAGQDDEFANALDALKQADAVPDEVACEAEKLRLTKMLAQPADQRALLLRSML